MIPAAILGTAAELPGTRLTTADVLARTDLAHTPAELEGRTGIHARHWVGDDRPAADIAAAVLREALAAAGLAPASLRRVIFVNSTGGDFLIPATANDVLHRLGVAHTCDGFDVNNACMGFLTALDLAARTVATGLHPVGVVAVEVLSRFLAPADPRPFVVLADAAGAAVLGPARSPREGFLATAFGNDGALRGTVSLRHPGLTGEAETIRFEATHREIAESALSGLTRSADRALAACGLTMADIDWVVPHQPNGSMLRTIQERLGIPPERLVPVVAEVGSVGAASTAVGLDVLLRTRPVRPGHRVLLVGVGAGMAYGALVHQVGP